MIFKPMIDPFILTTMMYGFINAASEAASKSKNSPDMASCDGARLHAADMHMLRGTKKKEEEEEADVFFFFTSMEAF